MDFAQPLAFQKGDAAGGMARKGATLFFGAAKNCNKKENFFGVSLQVSCFFCMSQNGELGFFQLDDLKLDDFKT